MLIEHRGKRPDVHATAWVAPTAVLCGDVTVGAGTRVLYGAVVTADGGPVMIGAECVVMENAVLRGTPRHPLSLADNVLVGPRAYLTGCTIEANVFLATGATVFNGAHVGTRSEVRINGVVHLRTRLEAGTTVPIGWIAVGDPALIRPPKDHDEILAVQDALDFPGTVFGLERAPPGESIMPELTRRYAKGLARHREDRIIEE